MEYWTSYSEQTNEWTSKRQTVNSIYLTLEIAILGFAATQLNIAGLFLSIAGLALCLIWFLTILSFKKLSKSKFDVVTRIENEIGADIKPYQDEWNSVKTNGKRYINITTLEFASSCVMALLFVACLVLSAAHLI